MSETTIDQTMNRNSSGGGEIGGIQSKNTTSSPQIMSGIETMAGAGSNIGTNFAGLTSSGSN